MNSQSTETTCKETMTQVFQRYFVATLAVVIVLVLCFSLYKLSAVALLFAISGLLAYLLSWPVERLSRRMNRSLAVWLVFIGFAILLMALFGSILPVLSGQIQSLLDQVPYLLAHLEKASTDMRMSFMGREIIVTEYFAQGVAELESRIPDIAGGILGFTQSFVSGTATVIAAMLIIPLMTLYLLLDSQRLRMALVGCFAEHWRNDVDRALTAVSKSLGSYIYSRMLLATFVGTTVTITLMIAQVDYALLFGLLAFAGEFIPVIGPWLAFAPIALIVLATSPMQMFWIGPIFIAIQLFENYWLAPRWMGNTMDLHPLTVIMAMLIGGTLGGIAGLLVAVPIAAALKVIFGIFIFRREEPGIDVPQLDLISGPSNPDIQENHSEG